MPNADHMKPREDPIEGLWWGSDKVAHFLVPLAVTPWVALYAGSGWAKLALVLTLFLCMAWEGSNYFRVLRGKRGVSILDLLAFLVGGIAAGLLLWWAP
jgi:hypothetical protein